MSWGASCFDLNEVLKASWNLGQLLVEVAGAA